VHTIKWDGPVPALYIEHGTEQQQAPRGSHAAISFPYIVSKAVDIMVCALFRREKQRWWLAGCLFPVMSSQQRRRYPEYTHTHTTHPLPLQAFDPLLSHEPERGFLAGATVSVEQVLEQPRGTAPVGLFDTKGSLRGHVRLQMELLPVVNGSAPMARPLLDPSGVPLSPFAAPE